MTNKKYYHIWAFLMSGFLAIGLTMFKIIFEVIMIFVFYYKNIPLMFLPLFLDTDVFVFGIWILLYLLLLNDREKVFFKLLKRKNDKRRR